MALTPEERSTRRDRRAFWGALLATLGIGLLLIGMFLLVGGKLDPGEEHLKLPGLGLATVGYALTYVGFQLRGARF